MAYSSWLGTFGWSVFFIAFVAAIFIFANKRKFYPVMYLVSIATYIFTVGFIIDAFNFSKNMILITLAVSSVVFIGLGIYFAKKFEGSKGRFLDEVPRKR